MAKDRSYPNIRPAIATAVTAAIRASEETGKEHHAVLTPTGRASNVRYEIIEGRPAHAVVPKGATALVLVAFDAPSAAARNAEKTAARTAAKAEKATAAKAPRSAEKTASAIVEKVPGTPVKSLPFNPAPKPGA